MIVVDASVVVVALADGGPDGDTARARLRGETLAAPELLELEVASVLRRLGATGAVDVRHAPIVLDNLLAMPIERVRHGHLLDRCWQLRDNLTIYDAAYVALAELYDATLLTADGRLARSPGPRCTIELMQSAG